MPTSVGDLNHYVITNWRSASTNRQQEGRPTYVYMYHVNKWSATVQCHTHSQWHLRETGSETRSDRSKVAYLRRIPLGRAIYILHTYSHTCAHPTQACITVCSCRLGSSFCSWPHQLGWLPQHWQTLKRGCKRNTGHETKRSSGLILSVYNIELYNICSRINNNSMQDVSAP